MSIGSYLLSDFIIVFSLAAYLEPSHVLEYLAYFGFTYQIPGLSSVICPPFGVSSSPFGAIDSDNIGGESYTNWSESASFFNSSGAKLASSTAQDLLSRGITVTAEKRLDVLRHSTKRTVFYCRIYGSRKVGKVSHLNSTYIKNLVSKILLR
ncbi:unnamed protein product [Protopolystoma xenopodis]|uniref:Uncharacterized protein n=1 Tax=Protopolystoma xenopodis TaxID=117903 RepID=A0A448XR54_9PLAT|nr:unnamed protein product [Protopolystoma xenopodis]